MAVVLAVPADFVASPDITKCICPDHWFGYPPTMHLLPVGYKIVFERETDEQFYVDLAMSEWGYPRILTNYLSWAGKGILS